jgi:frataxin-like iron-binding protein CyaY
MLRKRISITAIVLLIAGLIVSCSRASAFERTAISETPPTGIVISITPKRTILTEPSSIIVPKTTPTAEFTEAHLELPTPSIFSAEQFKPTSILNMETYSFTNQGRWTIYTPAHWRERYGQRSNFPSIVSIAIDLDGAVWFATMGGARFIGDGVYRFDGENWTHFSTENGLPSDEVSSMAVTPDGAIWFSTLSSGIARFDGETWVYHKKSNGLGSNDVRSMAVAPDGKLWAGTEEKGVSVFDGVKWTTFKTQGDTPREYVGDIFILPNAEILFSSSTDGFAKLIQYDGTNWKEYPTPWEETGKFVMDMAKSPNNDIWFAMEFNGAYRLSKDDWINYTMDTGLISNQLFCVDVTSDDSVWLGTARGIAHYDGESWDAYLDEEDADNWIVAITSLSDGTVWFGSSNGIVQYVP